MPKIKLRPLMKAAGLLGMVLVMLQFPKFFFAVLVCILGIGLFDQWFNYRRIPV